MHSSNSGLITAVAPPTSDPVCDDLAAALGDQRPQASDEALVQLGRALMTELLDVIADTALEDFQTLLGEALIGAFHSAAGRIERDADRARDVMRRLDRDFDGSEASDVELQEATAKARSGDAATQAAEMIRDAASDAWTVSTGEVWTAWRGSRRGSFLTAAQLEAKQAIRAVRERRAGDACHRGAVVAFRGAVGGYSRGRSAHLRRPQLGLGGMAGHGARHDRGERGGEAGDPMGPAEEGDAHPRSGGFRRPRQGGSLQGQ